MKLWFLRFLVLPCVDKLKVSCVALSWYFFVKISCVALCWQNIGPKQISGNQFPFYSKYKIQLSFHFSSNSIILVILQRDWSQRTKTKKIKYLPPIYEQYQPNQEISSKINLMFTITSTQPIPNVVGVKNQEVLQSFRQRIWSKIRKIMWVRLT